MGFYIFFNQLKLFKNYILITFANINSRNALKLLF